MTPLRQQVEAEARKLCKKIPGSLHDIPAIEMRNPGITCDRCKPIANALESYAKRCEDAERKLEEANKRIEELETMKRKEGV